MFVLGLYLNETPIAYVRSPNVSDDVLFSMDALVYSTTPKYKLRFAHLSHNIIAFSHTMNNYTLLILTDRSTIPGFYKELLRDIRAKLVPYEGQDVEETLKPYGVRLIENLDNVYSYVPWRVIEEARIAYKRIVAETGHEAFGIDFGDMVAIFNRKGIILGEGKLEALEGANISSKDVLERVFGKKPRALILPSGPRSVWGFVLRVPPNRLYFLQQNDADKACISRSERAGRVLRR